MQFGPAIAFFRKQGINRLRVEWADSPASPESEAHTRAPVPGLSSGEPAG